MPNAKPRLCFVAPTNYPLLAGRADLRHIGGAEVQRTLIARELARRGYPVSFVTFDHGQPDGVEHDGIRVFKMCARDAGLPGLRFFWPRWSSLRAALKRADAEIYYQRTAGAETGQTAFFCRRNGRRFLLGIANDPECDRRLGGAHRSFRDRWLYKYGLKRAARVIAQTRTQQEMLAANFGIQATVIRSCSADPTPGAATLPTGERWNSRRVLWIGRFTAQKRLDRLLDLARQTPEFQFDVVGGGKAAAPEIQQIADELAKLPQVQMHGFTPHAEMGRFYERAALLLSTSAWEGYPNVFLEAWARGVPTISTIDPDGVVAAHGHGRVAETVDGLAAAIRQLTASAAAWEACAHNARRFFLENHSVTATVDAWETLLAESPPGA